MSRILLSAGHALSEFFVTKRMWDENLFYGYLLSPTLGIVDNSLLGTRYVKDHLDASNKLGQRSLLEQAIGDNTIRLYLRDPDRTFGEMVREFQRDDFPALSNFDEDFCARLDRRRYADELDIEYWPSVTKKSLGETFGLRAQKELSDDTPSKFLQVDKEFGGDRFMEFWSRSKTWRTEFLEEAKSHSSQGRWGENAGLQLAKTLEVFYRNLAIDPTDCRKSILVSDLQKRVVASDIQDKHKISDDIGMFFKILCDLYNANHASGFDDLSYLSPSNDPYSHVITNIDTDELDIIDEEGVEFEEYEIPFPSVRRLNDYDPQIISDEKKREMDRSHGFFEAQKDWIEHPSQENLEFIISRLNDYGKNIVRALDSNESTTVRHYRAKRSLDLKSRALGAALELIDPSQALSGYMISAANHASKVRVFRPLKDRLTGADKVNLTFAKLITTSPSYSVN